MEHQRERKRQADRDYYARNKDKSKARLKKWREKKLTPEQRKWRALSIPERRKLSIRRYVARNIKELRNIYVTGLLRQATGLRSKDIPMELIELKREQLQFRRLLKQLERTLNGTYQRRDQGASTAN